MRFRIFILTTAIGLLGTFTTGQIQAASQATGLSIMPATAIINADQTQVFTVTTTNADGTTTDVTAASTLSHNDPLGAISGTSYAAGKTGTWTIQATYQSLTAAATVTVTPGALAELVINPNSDPEYTTVGRAVRFSVAGYDQNSNAVTDVDAAWSVIGEIGTIDLGGLFTPTKVGTGKIQVQSGTITGQIPVVVSAAPAANTNANTNTAVDSTNSSAINNRNLNANTNTAETEPTITITNSDLSNTSGLSSEESVPCTTMQSWMWVVLLIVYLVAVFMLYRMVAVTAYWPVAAALVGAAVLAYIQRRSGCDLQSWWAWVMVIGTVVISLIALRSASPKTK